MHTSHSHLLFKKKERKLSIGEQFHRVSLDIHLLQFIEFIDRFMTGTRAPNQNEWKEAEF